MSNQSSSFIGYRKPGDCRPNADIVVYFNGETTDLPLVEAGNLVFKGGYANVPSQGIGMTGFGAGPFRLEYNAIKPGGAGVKIRCATTDTKQRLRFTVLKPLQCAGYTSNIVSLELKPVETCARAFEYDSELPLHLFKRCSTLETDCQILEAIARQFNAEYAHLGTAYTVVEVVSGVNVYALDIEAKNAGEVFRVESHEGLSKPRTIIPANKRTYTRELVQDWFGTADRKPVIYSGADAVLDVIELFAQIKVGSHFSGAATSDMNYSSTTAYETIDVIVTVIAEQNTNATAAKNRVISLLQGPGSGNGAAPYLSKVVDTNCADSLIYPYTIVRTDAGDDAARAQVKTDYPDIKIIYQAGYMNGKSYYEAYTSAATIPVPTATQAGDVVTKGNNQVPAAYTVSACPVGTACADCPPSPAAPL